MKIKKLKILHQNSSRRPWFTRNKQLHNDAGLSYLSTWIINQYNFKNNLNKPNGALHYKIIETSKPRLKPRLPQDISQKINPKTNKEDISLIIRVYLYNKYLHLELW